MPRRDLLALLLAFAVSVVVRWPLVDRPLSAHHEYCTAFTLIALTNWWVDGYTTHHGMPSGGFIREGERLFPPDRADPNERAVGLYYFSHPPLAFDLPYALFVLTDTPPNTAGLQWLNIVLHLVTAIGLYLGLRIAVPPTWPQAPLFAAILYLFLPATLWFHGNAYMSDMLVQVPWMWHLVFAIRILRNDAAPSRWAWVGFTVTLFLALYTSWLGVFALVSALVVALLRWRLGRRVPLVPILVCAGLAFLVAAGLTTWRFLQVIDAHALLAQLQSRLAVRGSFGTEAPSLPLLRRIVENYRISYLPVFALLLMLLLLGLRRGIVGRALPADLLTFILLAGLPVLLDHLVLLQYASHDFAALKAAPLLCALASWVVVALKRPWPHVAITATCLAGILYFHRINPLPGRDGGRYAQEMELGHFIGANAGLDEMVFGAGVSTEPQVIWYARRNVIGVADVSHARALLREYLIARGVVISGVPGAYRATHIIP